VPAQVKLLHDDLSAKSHHSINKIRKVHGEKFWDSIQENDYTIPAGHAVLALTDELFSYIGSTDAEL